MIKILENENFEEVIKEGKWLIDFNAIWCGPCRMIEPILEELSDKYNILKVDVDKHSDIAAKNGIMSIPTLIVYENGKQKNISVGLISKDQIEDLLK